MVYGINAGNPIANMALDLGVSDVYKHNTTFALILTGGFLVNTVWCLTLNVRNRSIREYVTGSGSLLLRNHLLVALAGILTYGQLFFYGMGTTKMGEYAFSSWSIQTALTLVFGNLWGVVLHEWKGVSRRTLLLLWGSILVLVLSAIIMGVGSYLATMEP
jgi:L-rhamnose-H+ transport protein